MSFTNITVEQSGNRVEIRIDRPAARNALNALTLGELNQFFAAVVDQPEVRTVILTGAGEKAFVAGADIGEMVSLDAPEAEHFVQRAHVLSDRIAHAPQIVIAAVNGFALGGGCELALACDFIYASTTATFGQPEVKLGVIPGFGGTQRLARRVGVARALELCTVGENIDAAEALRIGLVNAVCAPGELLPRGRAIADKVAQRAPLAVAAAKESVRNAQQLSLKDGSQREAALFAGLFATEDQREGMQAFLAKRPAVFTGR